MGSNDDAVAFLGKTCPPRLDVSLIARALQCRQADADPDALFAARTTLPAQVSRRYRAAHNVGHYRFVECGRIEHGRPEGNLAAWDEFFFPFDPSLRAADLSGVPVRRLSEGGPEVEEIYRCGADGTVEASLRVIDDGFERKVMLARR